MATYIYVYIYIYTRQGKQSLACFTQAWQCQNVLHPRIRIWQWPIPCMFARR